LYSFVCKSKYKSNNKISKKEDYIKELQVLVKCIKRIYKAKNFV